MFWNRKKRKQEKERKAMEEVRAGDKPAPEPDISEPIKSFLDVSDDWEVDSRVEDLGYGLDSVHVYTATDPETCLRVEVVTTGGILYDSARCLNHGWVTLDEAKAVRMECLKLERKRREQREREERHEWTLKYQERS